MTGPAPVRVASHPLVGHLAGWSPLPPMKGKAKGMSADPLVATRRPEQ